MFPELCFRVAQQLPHLAYQSLKEIFMDYLATKHTSNEIVRGKG
jgi:hypothetical protein